MIPLQIVVARYEENLDWLQRIHPAMQEGRIAVRVYNKSRHNTRVPIQVQWRGLENIGREADTFLRFIREEVEAEQDAADTGSLDMSQRAAHIAFLQGDPIAHCPDVLERMCWYRDYEHCDVAVPLGTVCFTDENGAPHHPGVLLKAAYEELFERAWPGVVAFSGGAQYVFPRRCLFDRPLSFWEKFHKMVLNERLGPWIAERLWWEALGVRMERSV